MTNLALVNNVDHKDVRIITERSARYGDDVMYTMVFPFEFRSIQVHYPILFHKDASGDVYPVALFGFEKGENLFLDDAGWQANYVPAMIRRQPFLIGYQGAPDRPQEEQGRVLSLDLDHPRVSTSEGEPLFQPLGGWTPYLEDTAGLMETIFDGLLHNKEFMSAIIDHELVESVTFEITLKDGSRNQLLGFHTIDEDRVRELPAETLGDFSRRGFLMPLFMVLASLGNIQALVDRKNARVGG